jgi:hypothetical protein
MMAITQAVWAAYKDEILDLYYERGLILKEVMAEMKAKYDFKPR